MSAQDSSDNSSRKNDANLDSTARDEVKEFLADFSHPKYDRLKALHAQRVKLLFWSI